MHITEHFTLDEMSKTHHPFDNEPSIDAVIELTRLCIYVMEPIRGLLGAPLIVHSGFRNYQVNEAASGSRNSAHLYGRACDFHPKNDALIRSEFEKILNSEIPFDRLLLEYKRGRYWIHAENAKAGDTPRQLGYVGIYDPDAARVVFRQVKRGSR